MSLSKFGVVFGTVAVVASSGLFAIAPASASVSASIGCGTEVELPPGVTILEMRSAGKAWTEADITSNPCSAGVEAYIQPPGKDPVYGPDVRRVTAASSTPEVTE